MESFKTLLCVLCLCTFAHMNTEGKAIQKYHNGNKLQIYGENEVISSDKIKHGDENAPTGQGGGLLGDILCQFCIKTNNQTCIARFCSEITLGVPNIEIRSRLKPVTGRKHLSKFHNGKYLYRRSTNHGTNKVDGNGLEPDQPVIGGILGDAMCQYCIETNNQTCIDRYCNQLRLQGSNPRILSRSTTRNLNRRQLKPAYRGNVYKRSSKLTKSDSDKRGIETKVEFLGDIQCQICINLNDSTCIERFCNGGVSGSSQTRDLNTNLL